MVIVNGNVLTAWKHGTLSKDEYLSFVEKRFKAADPDNDGTVSAAEFKTAAGQSLSQLLS
jgi:EF hand